MLETLITVSMGLINDPKGHHFIQIISPDEKHYFIPINEQHAFQLSVLHNLEIEEWDAVIQSPDYSILSA
jgi:hypothetical protein